MAINLEAPGESGANFEDIKDYLGAGAVNVLWFDGVDPTGATDSFAGIQAAVDAAYAANQNRDTDIDGWGIIFFPPGIYSISDTVDFDPGGGIECGVTVLGCGTKNTQITASMAKPLFSFGKSVTYSGDGYTTSIRANVSGIEFTNASTNAASGCVTLKGAQGGKVDRCKFNVSGGIGVRCYDEVFSNTFDSCEFSGSGAATSTAIGIHVMHHATIIACNFHGLNIGVRACGYQVAILNNRVETCTLGVAAGVDHNAASFALTASQVRGGSFESNWRGIEVYAGSHTAFSNISIHGISNNANGQLERGVYVAGGLNLTFQDIVMSVTHDAGTHSVGFDEFDWSFAGASGDIYLINCAGNADATDTWVYSTNAKFIFPIGGSVESPRENITQGTSKSTAVEKDNRRVQVTMHNATLNADTSVGFTLTNSYITTSKSVRVAIKSGATAASYTVGVDEIAAGSCKIHLRNVSAGNLGEAVVLYVDVED
jgi:hypothetical protein